MFPKKGTHSFCIFCEIVLAFNSIVCYTYEAFFFLLHFLYQQVSAQEKHLCFGNPPGGALLSPRVLASDEVYIIFRRKIE